MIHSIQCNPLALNTQRRSRLLGTTSVSSLLILNLLSMTVLGISLTLG